MSDNDLKRLNDLKITGEVLVEYLELYKELGNINLNSFLSWLATEANKVEKGEYATS